MTTPPAHAAQTVDVGRASVEYRSRKLDDIGQDRAAAMLRALFDAKEKAERRVAELERQLRFLARAEHDNPIND